MPGRPGPPPSAAYRMELVTRNVATQVKASPVPRQRRPDLSVADAKRLLKVIAGERLEALYVLALTTGLRRGELLALRWDDIDFDSPQLVSAMGGNESTASSGRSNRGQAAPGGVWCCPKSPCGTWKSTGTGRTTSAWSWGRLAGTWTRLRLVCRNADRAEECQPALGRAAGQGWPGLAPPARPAPRMRDVPPDSGCPGPRHHGSPRARRDRRDDEHLRARTSPAPPGGRRCDGRAVQIVIGSSCGNSNGRP